MDTIRDVSEGGEEMLILHLETSRGNTEIGDVIIG